MVLTPQQLWKNYDRKAEPLNVSVISEIIEGENDGVNVKCLYFDGCRTATGKGVARVFAKLYTPKNPNTSCVIFFDDPENTVDAFSPTEYLNRGFSVLCVDYSGYAENKARYTIYPEPLRYADFFLNEHPFGVDESFDPFKSCWYVYNISALRSVTLLESLGFSDIFILGVGFGGAQVWKTCYFDGAVKAGGVIFSTPAFSEASLMYKSALVSVTYANLVKVPVFIQITSNEENNTLDSMNEVYLAAKDKGAYLAISNQASRTINADQLNDIPDFFVAKLMGADLPSTPELESKGSQNQLYYDLKIDAGEDPEYVRLFVAYAQKNSAFRNWRKYDLEMVGEDEYICKVSVPLPDEPVYAFATVKYKNGFCISTAVDKVIPKSLGVNAAVLNFKRLIYDSSMGLSDFIVLSGANKKDGRLVLEKGPFDLEGIRSTSNSLTTFRLADPQFIGKPDGVLQLSLYSATIQKISFNITASDKLLKYSCIKELSPQNAWSKVALSLIDFRGDKGALSSWSEILTFEIESENAVLLNSMLWV